MEKDRIKKAIAHSRVPATRIFAAGIVFLLLFTGHSFGDRTFIDVFFELTGLVLLTLCSFGRIWALLYISGKKTDQVIKDGPYSIVRHPLYFFSAIGAVGIGMASENVLVLALIVIFYGIYYPFTILAEEARLTKIFGSEYIDYMKRTPRIIPKFSLYREPKELSVTTHRFVRHFFGGMWFIWIFVLMYFIEELQETGHLPVLFRVP